MCMARQTHLRHPPPPTSESHGNLRTSPADTRQVNGNLCTSYDTDMEFSVPALAHGQDPPPLFSRPPQAAAAKGGVGQQNKKVGPRGSRRCLAVADSAPAPSIFPHLTFFRTASPKATRRRGQGDVHGPPDRAAAENTPTRFVPRQLHALYLPRRPANSPNTLCTWSGQEHALYLGRQDPPPLFSTPPKAALTNNTTYSDREADGAA